MVSVIRKVNIIFALILMINLCACSTVEHVDKKEIKTESKTWMEHFVNGEKEELLEAFTEHVQSNYKDSTLEDMDKAYEFIDGKIVSYDVKIGGELENIGDGKVEHYYCSVEFFNVLTDTGAQYEIYFMCHYIWKARPEYEGIQAIRVRDLKAEESVMIGYEGVYEE